MKRLAVVAAVLALALTALGQGASGSAAEAPGGVTILGVDLHDGSMLKSGNTYYLYGTRYGCNFQWGQSSPWCGFGVATAASPSGPWSSITSLFSPNDTSPFANMTWQQLCGNTGAGCFNARMIQRSGWGANDGVWILWFNAPADFNRTGANAYYAMGCNGPAGPCGAGAGPPFGSTTKPSMFRCYDNGDFSIVRDDPQPPVMLCTMANQTLNSERLTVWGSGGTGEGGANLAGATHTEAPGAYRDPGSGRWIMTYNEVNCGYCAGTGTSYATASSPLGPWTSPGNVGWSAPASGRRLISGTSCGGQGRTVVTLDGQPYELIDLWVGTANETAAGIRLEPLVFNQSPSPPGTPWAPFQAWTCR